MTIPIRRPILRAFITLIVVAVAFYAGVALGPVLRSRAAPMAAESRPDASTVTTIWTCSMHPQIRMPKPGNCPICGMTLVPAADTGAEHKSVSIGREAQDVASIEVVPVERRDLAREIRAVGRIEMAEPSVANLTSRVDGRVEHVFADFAGTVVTKGDHLVDIYSPDLVVAQEEYLVASRWLAETGAPTTASRSVDQTWAGQQRLARQKLLLLGVTEEQLADLTKTGQSRVVLTVHAPIGGTVMEKQVREGMYVKTGDPLYTIANLETVWLFLELYEADLPWIAVGQSVSAEVEAAPGRTFEGLVAFVDPMVREATRTVRVRIDVPNPEGRLRPGMFAHATIHAPLAADGLRVAAPALGRFYCRMHPGVHSDVPGACRICGMALTERDNAESSPAARAAPVLAVPASAVLDTGVRRVVYVERPPGEFAAVSVTLGPKAGDFYPVLSGIEEGDRVVVHGNFLVDSQAQIEGKPSLLFPNGMVHGAAAHEGHGKH